MNSIRKQRKKARQKLESYERFMKNVERFALMVGSNPLRFPRFDAGKLRKWWKLEKKIGRDCQMAHRRKAGMGLRFVGAVWRMTDAVKYLAYMKTQDYVVKMLRDGKEHGLPESPNDGVVDTSAYGLMIVDERANTRFPSPINEQSFTDRKKLHFGLDFIEKIGQN